MDFEIGVILDKLKKTGQDKNTILIFSGDNGTPSEIHYSVDSFGNEEGAKSSSTELGTHVPLVAYWPGSIKSGSVNDDLIDFSDFFPTFVQAAGITNLYKYGVLDGLSFYNRMLGTDDVSKPQLFFHFNGHPGFDLFKRWVRDKTYKLYDTLNGSPMRFYNFIKDPKEKYPLNDTDLTDEELGIKTRFKFILDSMATWSDAPLINNPFVNNITSNSAVLGATIVNSGAFKLIDRGSTIIKTGTDFAGLNHGRMHDSLIALGTFSENRTDLLSETSYNFTLYAMNADTSHSTGYALGRFYTLSRPPVKQPKFFTAKANNCSIILNWSGAKFPSKGATKAGYAIFYSTDSIQLIAETNGLNPAKIIKNGAVALVKSELPNMPDTSIRISGLSKNIAYHFLLVPYTCNGITDSTYDYLTTDALTTTDSISYFLSLNYSAKNPVCFNTNSGSIEAFAFNGTPPYFFDLNSRNYTSDSIFKNLRAGTYLLRVKDLNNCIDSQTVILTDPSALQLHADPISATCVGDTASISASSYNGTIPYKYALNNSAFGKDSIFTRLSAGQYILKVKDANGCLDSESVVLTAPEQIKLNTSVKNEGCLSDGQITASASYGVEPYLFSFNNGQFDTVFQFSALTEGNYIIQVEDSNECTVSANVIVKSSFKNCSSGIPISPNPSNDEFRLSIGADQISNHIVVKVYNVSGKLVYSNHGTGIYTYSFGNNFIAGIYFVKVESDNTKYNFKIIKE